MKTCLDTLLMRVLSVITLYLFEVNKDALYIIFFKMGNNN